MLYFHNPFPNFYKFIIFILQEQYELAAYAEALNGYLESKPPLTHSIASRKIGRQWIKINDHKTYRSQLDDKIYLCMAVYRSQSQAVTDDLEIKVDHLPNWRASLQQHLRNVASIQSSTSTTTTATSDQSKVSLFDAYMTPLTLRDNLAGKYYALF